MGERNCSVSKCTNTAKTRGMCGGHYSRWIRLGDVQADKPLTIHGDDTARYWSKVEKRGPDECWPWRGSYALSRNGARYGQFSVGGRANRRNVYAHVRALELAGVAIPKGYDVDHLCSNTLCVNPAHLEPVTHRENVLRGRSPAALQARQTHCKRGHEFTPENTRMEGGKRRCRACRRADKEAA